MEIDSNATARASHRQKEMFVLKIKDEQWNVEREKTEGGALRRPTIFGVSCQVTEGNKADFDLILVFVKQPLISCIRIFSHLISVSPVNPAAESFRWLLPPVESIINGVLKDQNPVWTTGTFKLWSGFRRPKPSSGQGPDSSCFQATLRDLPVLLGPLQLRVFILLGGSSSGTRD